MKSLIFLVLLGVVASAIAETRDKRWLFKVCFTVPKLFAISFANVDDGFHVIFVSFKVIYEF